MDSPWNASTRFLWVVVPLRVGMRWASLRVGALAPPALVVRASWRGAIAASTAELHRAAGDLESGRRTAGRAEPRVALFIEIENGPAQLADEMVVRLEHRLVAGGASR